MSDECDALASKLDIMSLPRLVSWFVLTLYSPNLRRVRNSSARDFLGSVGADVGADVGVGSAGATSLFWLAHSSKFKRSEKDWLLFWEFWIGSGSGVGVLRSVGDPGSARPTGLFSWFCQ